MFVIRLYQVKCSQVSVSRLQHVKCCKVSVSRLQHVKCCQVSVIKHLQAVVRSLAESVSLTSTDAATAWNQASLPPPPLPAVEDPEGVNPSDASATAVASGAVALKHGSTTYNNFNDNSSAADNINITADGRTRTTISSPCDCCDANISTTISSTRVCRDETFLAAKMILVAAPANDTPALPFFLLFFLFIERYGKHSKKKSVHVVGKPLDSFKTLHENRLYIKTNANIK